MLRWFFCHSAGWNRFLAHEGVRIREQGNKVGYSDSIGGLMDLPIVLSHKTAWLYHNVARPSEPQQPIR